MKNKFLIIPVIVFLFAFTLNPVLADGNDRVYNRNSAIITNMAEVEAETGDNFADGSYGGSGGDGGSINNGSDDFPTLFVVNGDHHDDEEGGEVEESTTGDGGNGGNASDGGTVVSGDASAELLLTVKANRNLTEINRCGCADDEERFNDDGDSRIRNINRAMIFNGTEVEAETGENEAMGSYAGSGGSGGEINNDEGDVDEVTSGGGGTGGNGALGGLVQSGSSTARAEIVSRINENVTRITR